MIPKKFEEELDKNDYISATIEEFKASTSFAQTALKIPILINGGAAIAILAFLGHTWNKNNTTTDLANTLTYFSCGVLVAAVSTGVTYLTQSSVLTAKNEKELKNLRRWKLVAISLVIIPYVLFAFGAWGARSAFHDSKKTESASCICAGVSLKSK